MKATHKHFCKAFLTVTVIAACAASEALGVTYNVINLTPSSNPWSQALAASGGQQGGYDYVGGHRQALLWSGSAASGVNLHTGPYNESRINGMSGTQQAGFIHNLGSAPYHAYIWSGSAASGADLHPSGFSASCAMGTNGTKQAGFGGNFMIDTEGGIAITGGGTHALLWNGSPTDYTDLNPSGFYNSVATGISGTQQVGWGQPSSSSLERALLWSSTAASYVNLHPSGYYDSSAKGISGTQQVGMGRPNSTSWSHALLWNGSAASFIDLDSATFYESCANGTNGTQQVGWGTTFVPGGAEPLKRAVAWNGSADSYTILPTGGFYETWANGIDEYGNIVGGAKDAPGRTYAVLWQVTPEPATISLLAMGGLAMIRRRRK
jgi:hypothetical protein